MAGIGIPVKRIKRNSGSMMANYWAEATRDKEHLDSDVDPERTKDNIWRLGSPDIDFPTIVKNYADSQRDAKGRSIRSDAVVCMNAVLKPTEAYINDLSKEEQIALLDKAVDEFIDIQGRERFQEGRAAIVYHFDEQGAHAHLFWLPIVRDKKLGREKLSAKECCGQKWLRKVNTQLPGKLREAGYDIADADCWDADMTEQQKKELIERRKQKKAGRSSAQYKADQERKLIQLEQEADLLQEKISVEVDVLERKTDAIERRTEELTAKELAPEKMPEDSTQFCLWCMQNIQGVQEAVEGFCRDMYNKYLTKMRKGKEGALQDVEKRNKSLQEKLVEAKSVVDLQKSGWRNPDKNDRGSR